MLGLEQLCHLANQLCLENAEPIQKIGQDMTADETNAWTSEKVKKVGHKR